GRSSLETTCLFRNCISCLALDIIAIHIALNDLDGDCTIVMQDDIGYKLFFMLLHAFVADMLFSGDIEMTGSDKGLGRALRFADVSVRSMVGWLAMLKTKNTLEPLLV
ncbi:hypothetical protein ACJX0J_010516, partial [Zea mays]